MVDQPNKITNGSTPSGQTAQAGRRSGTESGQAHGRGEELKAQAHEKAEQAKAQARRMTEEAKHRGMGMLDEQKGKVAGQLGTIADALRDTARSLQDRNEASAGSWVHQAAGGLDRLSDTLRERDLDALMGQATDLARRQPAIFIGGAVAAGFLLTRFLKSGGGEHGETAYGDRPYSPAPRDSASSYVASGHVDPGEVTGGRVTVPPAMPRGGRDF